MIQDIQPRVYKNEFYLKREAKDTDLFLAFQGDKPFLYQGVDTLEIPTVSMIKKQMPSLKVEDMKYLFEVDGQAVFTVIKEGIEIPEVEGFYYQQLRVFRTFDPMWHGFVGVTACHLYKWYRSNRYCGCCGKLMVEKEDERAMMCKSCGFLDFPKICPVIIVGVINGDKILLTKYAGRSFTNYALIAGFCEIGETLEATIAREVMEEAGVRVKNTRYYASQPWGFSESLLMGFFADLDGDPTITLDEHELKEATWIDRADVPDDEENELSLTYTMMQAFKRGENV